MKRLASVFLAPASSAVQPRALALRLVYAFATRHASGRYRSAAPSLPSYIPTNTALLLLRSLLQTHSQFFQLTRVTAHGVLSTSPPPPRLSTFL